jgi:hypothetical protein
MIFLEKKKLKGHTYCYSSECSMIDGKIRRTWQEYLRIKVKIIECIRKLKEQLLKLLLEEFDRNRLDLVQGKVSSKSDLYMTS